MKEHELIQVLRELQQSSNEISLVMLVGQDGLPLCFAGEDSDFEAKGALYIELKLACDRVLSDMGCGNLEQVFVRSANGCIIIWPVANMLLACMASPSMNEHRLKMLAWRTVSSLHHAI